MVKIDSDLRARLQEARISTLHAGVFDLPADTVFEPPCSIKWMRAEHSLRLGAFSYAVSGYYFATSIARYVSIGEQVQIGRGSHPVRWASTSPVFYQRYEAVLNFPVPEAADYRTDAPYIAAKTTTIGNDVYIGHGAFLVQGVTIGDGAVIGAGAVVTKDVPPFSIVAGNPARVKGMRFDDPTIERMQRIKWWDYAFWDLSGAPVADPNAFLDFVETRIASGIKPYAPARVALQSILNKKSL
jgi:acetyltransferase-like isoleucine patch superfamily enzyme